jgi:hypothetical protein
MQTKKVFLNIASDFLRYLNKVLLNNQYQELDSEILVPPIVTRAKNLTQKKDVLVATFESESNNG